MGFLKAYETQSGGTAPLEYFQIRLISIERYLDVHHLA